MSDKMRQIPFGQLMDWILTEYQDSGTVFGVRKFYQASGKKLDLFGEKLETPIGPAAGPHSQLTQNIIASYIAGSRFFELKTCQVLDGEDLPVAKPCITAGDECYNCEWSTELYIPQAHEEYVKAWFALKLLCKELALGDSDGFIFNMSVGYDLEGIKTKKIDDYIEGMKNAEDRPIWKTCREWALSNLDRFQHVDKAYIESITPKVCNSITLSTLHGCPPDEIERIATYLITKKHLHTYIKCNPTLLGYEFARKTLDDLGFDYIVFDDHHFKEDLQFADAVPMFHRLIKLTEAHGLTFGVKLTNTFPVTVAAGELPSEEMYMSGRALYPLSTALALRLSGAFEGKLRISYSGGADVHNVEEIYNTGIWPITVATTLLKPGGYNRLWQMAEKLAGCAYHAYQGIDVAKLQALVDATPSNALYRKPIKPLPQRKMKDSVPLIDCFAAPCRDGCPIHQDIPAYLRLAGEGRYLEALEVITERNPLPFITGTICAHRCMDKCTRSFYEESVHIRGVKLEAAEKAYEDLMKKVGNTPKSGGKIAVIGGGSAGIAAAFFLARQGRSVTVFEKRASLGGIVRHVIPAFRISEEAIENDVKLMQAYGVEVALGKEITSLDALRADGFETVIVATGAWKPGTLTLEAGETMNVIHFLEQLKTAPETLKLGQDVVIIGGGNTAMDAARAAKRAEGVKKVSLVYRRTKRYMPADEEELALALEDGVEFCELLAPTRLAGGKLTCRVMALGQADASGRRSPVATEQTVEIDADTVISAVGELVDSALYQKMGIQVDEKGKAKVDAHTLETNLPGVYVIGDAMRGPATVVEAIADAICCTEAIAKVDVNKYADLNINPNFEQAVEKKGMMYEDLCAVHDSKRCLECPTVCEVCADVCPNRANIVVDVGGRPQIVHVDYMCNECGNCETFCPYSSAPYQHKFTLFANEQDFEDSKNEGFLLLPGGKVRVRLDGKVMDCADDQDLPADIWQLIQNTAKQPHLILQA